MIRTVTRENFDREVLQSEKPVVAEFWAPWCGYCRRLGPVVEALAEEAGERLVVAQINVDENEELEAHFEVMTIPTLILFREGKAGQPLVNPGSRAEIDAWLQAQGVELR